MKQAIKNLPIETVEIINQFLEEHPAYDRYEQPVEMDDLDIDEDGNIVYCYRWKTRTHIEEGHGFHTLVENYDEEYAFLLTKEQLEELKKQKQNA